MAIILKIPVFALFGSFWKPKYEKCPVHKLEPKSVHIVEPDKTIDDSNGALLTDAYHTSHCEVHVTLIDPL